MHECGLWKSSQQQELLQQAIPVCSDSSAVAPFISGNGEPHQTNVELTKSAALTALEADVPSQQQVRLGLQLAQLLYLHLHQDHPCHHSGPPMRIKGAGRTRSLRLQMLSPLKVFLPERHLSISKNLPGPHQRPTKRQRLLVSRPRPHGARACASAARSLPLTAAGFGHGVPGGTSGDIISRTHLPGTQPDRGRLHVSGWV